MYYNYICVSSDIEVLFNNSLNCIFIRSLFSIQLLRVDNPGHLRIPFKILFIKVLQGIPLTFIKDGPLRKIILIEHISPDIIVGQRHSSIMPAKRVRPTLLIKLGSTNIKHHIHNPNQAPRMLLPIKPAQLSQRDCRKQLVLVGQVGLP
jgi:hypothetical protein